VAGFAFWSVSSISLSRPESNPSRHQQNRIVPRMVFDDLVGTFCG
jgi:hypothetical protein